MTINIYDAQGTGKIEFGNVGGDFEGQMPITIEKYGSKNHVYMSLDKEDAKALVVYLKKEFKI